jgi:hypothetical protein
MNTPTVSATFVTFAELKMTYLPPVIGTDVFLQMAVAEVLQYYFHVL